ncbi:MAG: cupin domain-containing protein [Candidatus Levybacteria bacterium]|nr:cupin domain-containing protein [Candidatus Levybacteria bacterium]
MKIINKQDAVHLSKPEGINVTYYLLNEYEVHYNEQLPDTTQIWHHHEKIWETLYIIEGTLVAKWKDDEEEKAEVIKAGDLAETERTPHTFLNESGKTVKFLVIKQIPKGEDYKEILKTDKVIDQ